MFSWITKRFNGRQFDREGEDAGADSSDIVAGDGESPDADMWDLYMKHVMAMGHKAKSIPSGFSFLWTPDSPQSPFYYDTSTPTPRSGHVAVTDEAGNNMYIYGGYDCQHQFTGFSEHTFAELWKFHIPTQTWSRIETSNDGPELTCSCSAVMIGSTLIMFGGTGVPFAQEASCKVTVCDLSKKDKRWEELEANGEEPLPRFGQAMCYDNKQSLWIVGGTSGFDFFRDIWRFDLVDCSWEKYYDKDEAQFFVVNDDENDSLVPCGRYRHEMIWLEAQGILLIIGGGWPNPDHGYLDKTYAFDTNKRCWIPWTTTPDPELKRFPAARRSHSLYRLKSSVYLLGGTNGGQIFEDVWQLDLQTRQWNFVQNWEHATCFHTTVANKESGCISFGGISKLPQIRTCAVTSFRVQIPSLFELSLEAVGETMKQFPVEKIADQLPPKIVELLSSKEIETDVI